MAKPSMTQAKRARDLKKQDKRRDKEERRAVRKQDRENNPISREGDDPDLAGIVPGPQEPIE